MTTIQLRRGTASSAASDNPILADGEPGWDKTNGILKIGDGTTHWNDLPAAQASLYAPLPGPAVNPLTDEFHADGFAVPKDMVTIQDAAMTSGSNVLSSPGNGLAAAKVGQIVFVEGAGPVSTRGYLSTVVTAASTDGGATVTVFTNASTTVSAQTCHFGTDGRALLNAMGAAVPAGNWKYSGTNAEGTRSGRPSKGAVMRLAAAGGYILSGPVDLPGDSVLTLEGGADMSTRVVLDPTVAMPTSWSDYGSGHACFRIKKGTASGGQQSTTIKNLTLQYGNIEVDAQVRNHVHVSDVQQVNGFRHLVYGLGSGIVNLHVERPTVSESVGYLWMPYSQCDGITFTGPGYSVHSTGPDWVIGTSGVHASDLDHETRPSAYWFNPRIWLCRPLDTPSLTPGNDVFFTRVRFGNEHVDPNNGPPFTEVLTCKLPTYGTDATTTAGSANVTSATAAAGVQAGYWVVIDRAAADGKSPFCSTVLSVAGSVVTLADAVPSAVTGAQISFYGATDTSAYRGIFFRDCHSLGASTPSAKSGHAFMTLCAPLSTSRVEGGNLGPYQTWIDERFAYIDASVSLAASANARGNVWDTTVWGGRPTLGEYTNHATGWTFTGATGAQAQGSVRNPSGNPFRATTNWLSSSRLLSDGVWTSTRVTVAQDQTDIDGNANTAWSLTKNASGTANLAHQVTADANGTATFSIIAKQLTAKTMRLGVHSAALWQASTLAEIALDTDWQTYEVRVCGLVSGTTYTPLICVGSNADDADATTVGQAIAVQDPQFEHGIGRTATLPQLDTGGHTLRTRPANAQQIGVNIVDVGAAAPTTGRHEVGDGRKISAPAAGQPLGWVCSAAGTPGTFLPMPNIGTLGVVAKLTASTALTGAGDQTILSYVIPAGTAVVGSKFDFVAYGTVDSVVGDTPVLKVKVNAASPATRSVTATAGTGKFWMMRGTIAITAIGSGGQFEVTLTSGDTVLATAGGLSLTGGSASQSTAAAATIALVVTPGSTSTIFTAKYADFVQVA